MNPIWGSHQGEDAKLELLDKASGYCVSGSSPEARNLMTALSCNLVIQWGPLPIVKGQCPILNPEIHWNKVMYQFQCFYLWNSPSALLPPLKSQSAHRIKKHTICNASMQPHSENSSCSHKPKNRPLWTEWKKLFVFSSSFKPQIELPLLLE